jgi:hypothetical protein
MNRVTLQSNDNAAEGVLYMAMELGDKHWKLVFSAEPTLPIGPRSSETLKRPETYRLGPRKGPIMPRPRPRTRMLDSSRAQQYSTSSPKKGRLRSLLVFASRVEAAKIER